MDNIGIWFFLIFILFVIFIIIILAVARKRGYAPFMPMPSAPSAPQVVYVQAPTAPPPQAPPPPPMPPTIPPVIPTVPPSPPTTMPGITYQDTFQLGFPNSLLPNGTRGLIMTDTGMPATCGYAMTSVPTAEASLATSQVRFVSTTGKTGNVQYGDALEIEFTTSGRVVSICPGVPCGPMCLGTNVAAVTNPSPISNATWIIQNSANATATGNVQPTDQVVFLLAGTSQYLLYWVGTSEIFSAYQVPSVGRASPFSFINVS